MTRLVLIGVLLVVSLALVTVHQRAHDRQTANAAIGFSSFDQQSMAVGEGQWDFQFAEIEQILSTMMRPSGDVDVGSASLDKLRVINSIISREADFPWERLKFLTEKSFPASASAQLTDLVVRYARYQAELKAMMGDDQISSTSLARIIDLQRQVFDAATAKALFEKANATSSYLLQRKQIIADPSLDATQQKALLDDLKMRFKKTLKQGMN